MVVEADSSRAPHRSVPQPVLAGDAYVYATCDVDNQLTFTKRSETSHSLRPVTVAQLVRATQPHADAEWTIDGSEVGQVSYGLFDVA